MSTASPPPAGGEVADRPERLDLGGSGAATVPGTCAGGDTAESGERIGRESCLRAGKSRSRWRVTG